MDPLDRNIDILRSKLKGLAGQLPYVPRALALAWAAARGWTTAWGALLVVQGLLPVATVYLTKGVIDSLVAAMRAGGVWANLRPALVLVAAMAAVLALGEILKAVTGYVRAAQSELVEDHIRGLIHRKSVEADLGFYDLAEFYDHLHRAREEGSSRPLTLLENLGEMGQNAITLAAMCAVLMRFGVWVPLALAVSTLPAFGVVVRYSVLQHAWRKRVTPDERRTWYYDWLLTASEPAAEVRLFGLGAHFQALYQSLRTRLRRERLALAKGRSRAELGAGVFALIVAGAGMAWMVWRAFKGAATLGELTLFYQAFQQGLGLTRTLLHGVGQLYYNLLFLGNLFEFLSLEARVVSPAAPAPLPRPLSGGIRFRDLSFRYPATERFALEGFSLTVPAGTVAAVVGSNGAGKSTLLKLLCRFYDPQEGSIELDGTDLRRLDLVELRRRITVLFQQPVHYNASAGENIVLGDLAAPGSGAAVEAAAEAAGVSAAVQRLPQGFDTLLGRLFAKGTELSVGEWQRIALARAFFRQAEIIVLDEPTSAMDPWAEADWLRRFRRLAEGRTALIITHRFSTAMFADVIHVMSEGRIIESGTHQELLRLGGRYAAGWSVHE